jgi:hypothetical protein
LKGAAYTLTAMLSAWICRVTTDWLMALFYCFFDLCLVHS